MRILIIHNYYQDKGGEDVVFAQEVHELKKSHTVEIITFQNLKGWKGLIQFALYPWNIFAAKKVMRIVRTFKPDVVHIHNTHYALGPWIFRSLAKTRTPVIQTLHNFRLLDPSATLFDGNTTFTDTISKSFPWKSVKMKALDNSTIKTFWTAWVYYFHKKIGTWKSVNKYLIFSNFSKSLFLQSSNRLRKNQLAIKPNFVLPTELNDSIRKDFYIYVGRLSKEKGILSLLKAFSETSLRIKIFGTGPQTDLAQEYANKYSNIEYKGFQNKETINKSLHEAQALIVPSIWFEGMPMTVLESFSLGTPVLASRIGILQEMIIDSQNGLLFEPDNHISLLSTLNKWTNLDNSTKRNISENCKIDYLNNYSPNKNVLLLESIYKEVIQQEKLK